jgi:ubiquinone/menaquinone biosynthesis C-methylase UbiE
MPSRPGYLPAAGRMRLAGLYDPVLAATMRERTFRGRLVSRTLAGKPSRLLDLGTGTGSLAIALHDADPEIHVTGLDPDPQVLARAAAKAGPDRDIDWVHGYSEDLPFAGQSFDAVSCSLMFHHLENDTKQLALRQCLRVLEPGGWLQIADWGAARDPVMWTAFLSIRLLDGFTPTQAHAAGKLPGMIEAAGFTDVEVYERLRTYWGPLELIAARAPSASPAVSL